MLVMINKDRGTAPPPTRKRQDPPVDLWQEPTSPDRVRSWNQGVGGTCDLRITRTRSRHSVISTNWSASRSRKVCEVRLTGQLTVNAATRVASSRPIISVSELPPKLELPPIR